jgi:hypothetical protein
LHILFVETAMQTARRAGIVLVSMSAAIATLAAAMPARAADAPGWQIAAKVHYGASDNASGYSAVIAPARNDAWAFGGTNPGGPSTPAAERWDGMRWRASALPAGLNGFIVAAAASSASNVWAVGDGYVLRWNGVRWTVAKTWNTGDEITSVAVISRYDVWVFGSSSFSGQASLGTWHYDGRRWAQLTAAAGSAAGIYRASAVSENDIWAITVSPRGGSVVHYNGTAWDNVPAADAALADAQLSDVLAVSWNNVWVSGTTPANAADGHLVLAHWNGRCWRRFMAPWPVQQSERFAADGAGGIWIPVVTGGNSPATWILHLSRNGEWTRAEIAATRGSGVGVGDLALIPGTTTLWGTGGLVTTSGGDAAIWDRGVPADHLAVRIHRAVRNHLAFDGRGVIRLYLTGHEAAVRVFLIIRHPAPRRATAGWRPGPALSTGDRPARVA